MPQDPGVVDIPSSVTSRSCIVARQVRGSDGRWKSHASQNGSHSQARDPLKEIMNTRVSNEQSSMEAPTPTVVGDDCPPNADVSSSDDESEDIIHQPVRKSTRRILDSSSDAENQPPTESHATSSSRSGLHAMSPYTSVVHQI